MRSVYKKEPNGDVRVYSIEEDGTGRTRIHKGVLGGKMEVSRWLAHEPSHQYGYDSSAKAKRKAGALLRWMVNKHGWSPTLAEADPDLAYATTTATAYRPQGLLRFRYPVHVQPWVPGIRVLASEAGVFSGHGRKALVTGRIEAALRSVFSRAPGLVLDGVLVLGDDADREDAFSGEADADTMIWLENNAFLHVVDAADGAGHAPFDLRFGWFGPLVEEVRLLGGPVGPVETLVASSRSDVDSLCQTMLERGWPGAMVRVSPPGSSYERGASDLLMERKDFFRRDFRIVRLCDGFGPMAGCAVDVLLKTPDLKHRFKARLAGSRAERREAWEMRKNLEGGLATVSFQKMRADGTPLQAVATELKPTNWK